MSPLWAENRLQIGLAPGTVQYAYVARGWRARRESGKIDVPAPGAEPWRGAVAALTGLLPRMAAGRPACTVVLSNHFTRCEVLPWHEGLAGFREYEALARARFHAIHGAMVDAWEIGLSRIGYGAPVLACAVDRALLGELEILAADAGGGLASVQPLFAVAFNRWRASFRKHHWWFALIEPGRLWLGRGTNGTWNSVVTRQLAADPVADILSALDRERTAAAVAGGADAPVQVIAMDMSSDDVHALRAAGFDILAAVSEWHSDSANGAAASSRN